MPLNQSAAVKVTVAGEDIAPAERERALQYLAQTRESIVQTVKGLSESQWTFRPASDRWSISEILDHLVVTQELVLNSVFPQLAQAPPPPEGTDAQKVEAGILTAILDRSTRFTAPEALAPTLQWSPEELLDRFLTGCDQLGLLIESRRDLRIHAIPHRVLGLLDGYQWTLTMVGHADRHTRQILEVQADPNFPSSPRVTGTN